jgi:hypothetical protein
VRITRVRVNNRSQQTVAQVDLKLLVSVQGGTSIQKSYDISRTLTRSIDPERSRWLKLGSNAFTQIEKLLDSDGLLRGDLVVDVAVSGVRFADGSEQRLLDLKNGQLQFLFPRMARAVSFRAFQDCPNEVCKYVQGVNGGPPAHYVCNATTDPISCDNGGTSCTNTICTGGGGDDDDDDCDPRDPGCLAGYHRLELAWSLNFYLPPPPRPQIPPA